MCELHDGKDFYIQISIELKIEIAKHVLNRFMLLKVQEREHPLSYLVVCVSCLYDNQLLSYGCFYCLRSIIRNH